MGLPLFVAPVESDLLTKTANKLVTSSPPRSSIRRLPRADSRDRRHAGRRAGVGIFRPTQRNLPATQERFLPWMEALAPSEHGPFTSSTAGPRPMREALREMTRSDDRRRERLEERMTSLFGSGWLETAHTTSQREDQERPDGDLGWWSVEPRPRARRARVVPPMTSRYSRSPDGMRAYNRSPPLGIPNQLSRPQTSQLPSIMDQPQSALLGSRTLHPRIGHRLSSRRGTSGRRGPGVDGLGDRDRSLSPEVWDTLLTTLTPDPQPPSAGSSFASVVASQSAGPSSSTPTTAPDLAGESAVDPQCDSGCEHSDMDEADYEHPDFARIRRRRAERQQGMRANMYNLDEFTEGPFARRPGSTDPERMSRMTVPDGPLDSHWAAAGNPTDQDHNSLQVPEAPIQRPVWEGQMSVGASDNESGHRSSTNPDGPVAPGAMTAQGEEEWASGMRRIVRSLARREDIPDEWWAEAGLGRTLPQNEAN